MSDNMMTCDRCGSGVPAGASTCPNCGAPVGAAAYETRKVEDGWSAPEVSLPPEPQASGYEPTVKVPEEPPPAPAVQAPAYTPPVFKPAPPAEKPKSNRIWQIVAGCAALLVICICLAIVVGVIVARQMGAF